MVLTFGHYVIGYTKLAKGQAQKGQLCIPPLARTAVVPAVAL